MSDEIVRNLKKPSAWFRVLFMAGFVIALYVTGVILLVLMLAQVVFSLLTGEDNINLRRLGAGLASYVSQILAFLTYNSEQKPFPFLPYPIPPAQPDVVVDPAFSDPFVVYPTVVEPVVTEPAETQATAAGSVEEAQAVADDDGFQNASEHAETSQAPDVGPAVASRRSANRKKKATDPEVPFTDD